MADNSDSRESDNNSWVIAGSEALPVEELSAEGVEEIVKEAELVKDDTLAPPTDSKLLTEHPEPEEAKLKDPGLVLTPSSGPAKTPEPTHLGKEPPSLPLEEPRLHDVEASSAPGTEDTLIIHKAGPLEQHVGTSSSEEEGAAERDVEGLRRRKGRDVPPAQPGSHHDRRGEAPETEDGGPPGTKWVLGCLALLGLGFLAFSGVIFDLEEGKSGETGEGPVDTLDTWRSSEGEELRPDTSGKGWPTSPPPEPRRGARPPRAKDEPQMEAPKKPQSLDAMGVLLDKLAKENQEIRLMQAELQSQKEELQGLLRKTEGEALEFTSQQQNLAAENTRLRESLQQETSALLAVQAELRFLQEKLREMAGEADGAGTQRHGEEEPAAGRQRDQADRPESELRRLRSLLESVRHDLAKALQITPSSDGAEGLRTELSAIQQKLGQELERPRGTKPSWREAPKAKRGKERAWPKRHEGQEGPRPGHPELSPAKDHRSAHKIPKAPDDGPHRPRKHQGPRDAKSAKEREPQSLGRKARKPSEPSALWEMLTRHHFRPPQGCAGIAECARQEGLAPVQKTGFLQVVQNYLDGLGWAEHYGGLAAALEGFFGSDGAFAHNRTSFVDFLDEIEDVLEDLAQLLGGSEEAVDDFEEVVLRQLEVAPGGRFSQRDGAQRNPKERPREGHGRRNGKEGNHRSHG
ncbi:PREDICTED: pre-B-cell leukemia transcription factor-interacting protein 1 isoform X2 [Gekko japonicus]|uniref:Pre-B-cell leukemia transcription factor-interacting protein 1 isoform X2 n=1 Tax=Gekko japonicus TaxID=146911 RepID=A0ABM1KLL6_GEKJA|nr:PREDICTED: pre-B-cell leukemia transcription factor-interacting protein 1 isoform X2 [Gekko japonicus]